LTELERRGLITSGPFPVLTQAGIAEAQWFTRSGSEENEIPDSRETHRPGR
jgi:hypothetical protein